MNDTDNSHEADELPEIDLTFTLTPDDVYTFQQDHLKTSKISGIFPAYFINFAYSIILAVIGSALIIYLLLNIFGDIPVPLRLLLTAAMFILLRYSNSLYYKNGAKKQYEQDTELQKPANIKIYKDKIVYTSEMSFAARKFEELYKLTETKNLFLIYISEYKAHIMPKRFFSSPEEIIKTRELLSNITRLSELDKKSGGTLKKVIKIYFIVLAVIIALVILAYILFYILDYFDDYYYEDLSLLFKQFF